ncbi:MAG: hypothetical protein ACQKBV_00720 [Puniceicoccales bacterium]
MKTHTLISTLIATGAIGTSLALANNDSAEEKIYGANDIDGKRFGVIEEREKDMTTFVVRRNVESEVVPQETLQGQDVDGISYWDEQDGQTQNVERRAPEQVAIDESQAVMPADFDPNAYYIVAGEVGSISREQLNENSEESTVVDLALGDSRNTRVLLNAEATDTKLTEGDYVVFRGVRHWHESGIMMKANQVEIIDEAQLNRVAQLSSL